MPPKHSKPSWLTPAVLVAAYCVLVLATSALGSGMVVTKSRALGMVETSLAKYKAEEQARIKDAAATALTPYCVQASLADPHRYDVLLKIKETPSEGRAQHIMDAGWATPQGASAPDALLAGKCLDALNLR